MYATWDEIERSELGEDFDNEEAMVYLWPFEENDNEVNRK